MVRKSPCIALIADIVQSKEIPKRDTFQRKFDSLLGELSKKRKTELLSPYTITLGDEFQAVYADYTKILPDIWHIQEAVYPVKLRFALGYGKLTTEINPLQSIGMDGPAFHRAREVMDTLKEVDWTLIQLKGEESKALKLFNQSLWLMSLHQNKWKKTTYQIFWGLLGDQSVEQLSESLERSERAIYKQINTHHLREYISFSEILAEFLTSLHE